MLIRFPPLDRGVQALSPFADDPPGRPGATVRDSATDVALPGEMPLWEALLSAVEDPQAVVGDNGFTRLPPRFPAERSG